MQHTDPVTRAVVPPLHVSTTFYREPDNTYPAGFIYARPDNQTVRDAESVIAMLEAAGAGALLFASGMAAATSVFRALDPGDHVVVSRVMYWALRNWLAGEATRWGLRVEFVDSDNLDDLRAAVKPGRTKLVYIETPGNPLWTITDIAAAAEIAHQAGARLAVDSTAASPYHTQPLALGADIVMHAATKILNGHTDVVCGALAGRVDDEFWARLKQIRDVGRRDRRAVRSVSADARSAHALRSRASAGGERAEARGKTGRASEGGRRVVSGFDDAPGARSGGASDEEWLRLHDVGARRGGRAIG